MVCVEISLKKEPLEMKETVDDRNHCVEFQVINIHNNLLGEEDVLSTGVGSKKSAAILDELIF